jgi:hypothetical protein
MLAPGPSQPSSSKSIPYGLVSLRDMINYCLEEFVDARRHLEFMLSVSAIMSEKGDGRLLLSSSEEHMKSFKVGYENIECILRDLSMDMGRLARIKVLIKKGRMYAELEHELRALRFDIDSASSRVFFYHYPDDKAGMVLRIEEDWAATLRRFLLRKRM